MGYISVTITLTNVGTNVGPFDLYTNADNYAYPIAMGLTLAQLSAGYVCNVVPDNASIIRVQSIGDLCTNYIDLPITGMPTPTPTPSTTPGGTPLPTPTNTPTNSPTPSNSPTLYTVYFTPIQLDNFEYRQSKKSYVHTTPALQPGDSFTLYFTNYAKAQVFTPGGVPKSIYSNADRRTDAGPGYWNRAHADIPALSGGTDTQTTTGSIIIDSTNINDIYFFVQAVGNEANELDFYTLTATSSMTNVVGISGSYVIDNGNYMIGAYVNPQP